MRVVGRVFGVAIVTSAVMSIMVWAGFWRTAKVAAAPQQGTPVQWVDPANPSDELVDGPYRVDPNWPKPLATSFPEDKDWTWGAVQGIFAQNPDRIFVAMRGELPDLAGSERQFMDFVTAFGIHTHLEVPGRGMYGRNASVGDYASPGEATNMCKGTEGKDYQWKHVITVYNLNYAQNSALWLRSALRLPRIFVSFRLIVSALSSPDGCKCWNCFPCCA